MFRISSPLRLLNMPDHKEQSLVDHYIYASRPPERLVIPLKQHRGRTARAVVQAGDRVLVGQTIGEPDGADSVAVHASVSGTVISVGLFPHPEDGAAEAVEIRNDGSDTLHPSVKPPSEPELMSGDEMLRLLKDAGVAELDRTGEPVHKKLAEAREAGVETIVINACESEPFETSLHVLIMNKSTEILRGIVLLRKFLRARRIVVAMEDNKMDAFEVFGSKLYGLGLTEIEPRTFPARYPQGRSEVLLASLLNCSIEEARDPASLGVVVFDMATCLAVSEAVYTGKPLYERLITVSGRQTIPKPKNLLARIGTDAASLFDECGGMLRPPARVVFGGPMSGSAQATFRATVTKQTASVVALVDEAVKPEAASPCIRCGVCQDTCPAGLLPEIITLAAEQDEFETARAFNVAACIECGNCTYVCPSRRPMQALLSYAKAGADRS